MRLRPLVIAGACPFFALAGCAPGPESSVPWFREQARERGLDWTHVRGRAQRYWFPEIMGGGVGLVDLDGDGALDVYLVQSGDLAEPAPLDADRIFRNLGGGRFADATARAGGAQPGYGMGCACGDADQDGDADVYVTRVGPNVLLRNVGGELRGLSLQDVTAESGTGDPNWGTSAAWLDHDADGDLDLFVVNYVRWSKEREIACRSPQGGQDYCSPLNYDAPTRAVLYLNEGDGRFTDVSEVAGLGAAFGNGLGVVSGDLDEDGRIDVYVANDMMPNQLWKNRGDGTFVDRALLAGCAVNKDGAAEAGMGIVAVDAEDDGDLDLFVTHLRDETNTFFRNQAGLFTDQTPALGLGAPSLPFTGFGVGFQDFDRDGVLDVYVANGAVTRNRAPYDSADPYAEPDQLFRGSLGPGSLGPGSLGPGLLGPDEPGAGETLRFEELMPRGGVAGGSPGNSRGAAFGDLDEDGDVDIVVVENGARVKLLENVAPAGHWIGLAVLERSGAHAEGARVAIECGDRVRRRLVSAAGSYCASNDPRILCGLGDGGAPVMVGVRWVDGSEEGFGPLDTDRKHTLRRGTGTSTR